MEKLQSLKPVLTQPASDFGAILNTVLSPAKPLQSEEYLRGRSIQLQGIRRALYSGGRHVLIHGLRGVGKSSLAQTAAFSLEGSYDPIIIGCESSTTFGDIVREVYDTFQHKNPTLETKSSVRSASISAKGVTFGGSREEVEGRTNSNMSTNEAVRLLSSITSDSGKKLVILVDEFDQITGKEEQTKVANFIKQVSDQHLNVTILICGIGESAEKLMEAHPSADRYFHTVSLGQLPYEAGLEIVRQAADTLGIEVDDSSSIRITKISDGFPHYIHFLCEKLFWNVYDADNGGKVTSALFQQAVSSAAESMEMKLRGPYEKATRKYSNEYEHVLWAAADGHEFSRRSTDIFDSYNRICYENDIEKMDRTKFNNRLNSLKRESHKNILTGSRAGWYEFTEKMLRGYVRLRAEMNMVELLYDHPGIGKSSI